MVPEEPDYDLDAIIEGRRPTDTSWRGRAWGANPGAAREQRLSDEELEEQPITHGPSPDPAQDIAHGHQGRVSERGQQTGGTKGRETQAQLGRRLMRAEAHLEEAYADERPLDKDEEIELLGAMRSARDYAAAEGSCPICEERWRDTIHVVQEHRGQTWNTYDFAWVVQPMYAYREVGGRSDAHRSDPERYHNAVAGGDKRTRKEHRQQMIDMGWEPEPWTVQAKEPLGPGGRKAPVRPPYPYHSSLYPFGNWARSNDWFFANKREKIRLRTAYRRAAAKRRKSHKSKKARHENPATRPGTADFHVTEEG